TPTGVEVLGYFGEKFESKYPYLGPRRSVSEYLEENGAEIDEIYCSLARMEVEEVNDIVDFADNNLIQVMFIPDQKGIPYAKLNLDYFGHVPILTLRHLGVDELPNRLLKRFFDFIFSSLVIVLVLSWLIPIVAILIKMDSRGPVFFVQQRSGKKNQLFPCIKFRTMRVNREANEKQATRGDKRITKLGAFLRKSSIDELPQFLNVWLGHMSVVGPRPHMLSHTEEYSKKVNKFMVRHMVKPGITGLSQIMGLRGDTSEEYQMRHRVRVDIFYIENWSFLLDLRIIGLTVWNLFKGDDSAF
ncbi:MAG: exopolysaccharide biosynthesis polyprenyl glycosylphosphotransferase, partial [Luteibaculum sp.]